MGWAEYDARYELAHRAIGKDKSKIEYEFLLGVPDCGEVRVRPDRRLFIHLYINFFLSHLASFWPVKVLSDIIFPDSRGNFNLSYKELDNLIHS